MIATETRETYCTGCYWPLSWAGGRWVTVEPGGPDLETCGATESLHIPDHED